MSTATAKDRSITLRESDALRAMPAMNPQALIAAAIEKGASVETLERLVALATTLRALTAKEAYNEAISEFQRRCPPIKKNKTAAIGDRFTYRYADLGEILPTISPLMGELGLSISWRSGAKPNAVVATCRISHKMGHSEDSGEFEIPYRVDGRMNPAQAVGSAITYAKRYALTAVLGISPEDDDDGHGSDNGGRGGKDPNPRTMAREGSPEPRTEGATGQRWHIAPADPDSPALKAESENLFPTPDPIRDPLIKRIEKFTTAKIKVALHRVLSVDPEINWRTMDPAAMDMLARHLEVK